MRVKRLENVDPSVTRIAKPVMNAAENTVDVNYTVLVHGRNAAANAVLRETHRMRYLLGRRSSCFSRPAECHSSRRTSG